MHTSSTVNPRPAALDKGKVSTPEVVARHVEGAARRGAGIWGGDCPVCRRRQALSWTANAEGRAAEFVCVHGCQEREIIAALKHRAAARRPEPAPPARLPKALQDAEGADMEMVQEPEFLPAVPREND